MSFRSTAPLRRRLQVAAASAAALPGIQLGDFDLDRVGLNDFGDTAFCWLVGPFEFPFGLNGGLFRAKANGLQQAVVLPGVTPAPGGGVFVGCYFVAISNTGDVVFTGLVQRGAGPVEQGVFLARADGTILRIAGAGDPAPGGGVFSGAYLPRISLNGRNLTFDATLEGSADFGVYVRRGGGALTAVARPGDPAPGGGTIVSAIQPTVNSRGDVLYGAEVTGQSIPSLSLFLAGSNGTTRAIVRPDDLLPDGSSFAGLVDSRGSWSLNDGGEAAFAAFVQPALNPFPLFEATGLRVVWQSLAVRPPRGQRPCRNRHLPHLGTGLRWNRLGAHRRARGRRLRRVRGRPGRHQDGPHPSGAKVLA